MTARPAVPRDPLCDWFTPIELARILVGWGPIPAVVWTYTFVARSPLARLALLPVVQGPWRGFMRVGMRRLTELAEAEARPPA